MKAVLSLLFNWVKTPVGFLIGFCIVLVICLGLARYENGRLKDKAAQAERLANSWETKYDFAQSKYDSLKGIGGYKVDTLWAQRMVYIDREGKPDSIIVPCPDVRGSVSIDTTKHFGPRANPFGVRVAGKFYWPEEFAHKNWMIIDVLGWRDPDEASILPTVKQSGTGYGIGLGAQFKPNGGMAGLISARFQRTSVFGGFDFKDKMYLIGFSRELFGTK